MNVGMVNDGNGNFTYTVSGLNDGDTIEYFFTYNPGNGALDTAWMSYTLGTQGGGGDEGGSGGNVQNGLVTMYADLNYGGGAASFGVGRYDMADMVQAGIANDSISSIKVPIGYKLTVFSDIHFAGESRVFDADSSYVGEEWNDKITSFIIEEASYYIYNKHSGLVLEVANAGRDNGTNLIQNTLNHGEYQQWKVVPVEGGCYKIISVMHEKAIDVADLSTANGGNVHIWEYVGGDNQKWIIESAGGSYKTIVNKLSGLSLDGDDWSTTPGGNIIQWQLGDGQANQQWEFVLVNPQPANP